MSEVPLYQNGVERLGTESQSEVRNPGLAFSLSMSKLSKPFKLFPSRSAAEGLRIRLTNLPGQWLQCQANDSNVCRVHREGRYQRGGGADDDAGDVVVVVRQLEDPAPCSSVEGLGIGV